MRRTRKYTSKTHLLYEKTLEKQINLAQVRLVDESMEVFCRDLYPFSDAIEDRNRIS